MEEPTRKSVLDYVRDVKRSDLYRLLFFAQINTNSEDIVQLFDNTIKEKCSQMVTGLLLVSSNFIIHLIESSEDEVFKLCNEVFTTNSKALTNVKYIHGQNNVKTRFFKKWYYRKVNEWCFMNEETVNFENNFDAISIIHETVIVNLYNLYNELWNTCEFKSYADFIVQLDLLSKQGHSNIPRETSIDFIVKSRWGYDLTILVKDYCNSKYPCDFDDCSTVSDITREIHFDVNKYKYNFTKTTSAEKDDTH